jgi:hypothetical protein
MTRKLWFASSLAVLALTVACGKQSAAPTSPSATAAASADAAADGSTLKVTAPTPVAPINGVKVESPDGVALFVSNASGKFAGGLALRYEFEVVNAAGSRVFNNTVNAASSTTGVTVTAELEGDQTYRWRARAVLNDAVGPWSGYASFVAPTTEGYIRGNELYDPLMNGKSVGTINGPVSFSSRGVNLQEFHSHISYVLPLQLPEGEFSMFVSNIKSLMAGGKTKLMAMGQGFDDIVVNEYRATLEKRGNGLIAWRFIARDDQIDTEGAEREYVEITRAHEYFVKMEWRNNYFNVIIREDGVNGRVVYEKGKHWDGRGYVPNPHVVHIGAPAGRSGLDGATVPGMVARQVWVSSRPRPAWANK